MKKNLSIFNNILIKNILDERDKINSILQLSLNLPALKKTQESIKVIDENLRKNILPILKILEPIAQKSLEFLQSPEIKFHLDIERAETFVHEVFVKLFPDGFDKTELQNNWDGIRIFLKERWPNSLMGEDREERLQQIYKAQDVGAYIAVCRAVYPEIECLLREELLFKNNNFLSEFLSKEFKDKRTSFFNTSFSPIKKYPYKKFGFSDDTSLNEVGIFTASFLDALEKSFESYDLKNNLCENSRKEIKNNRHFHCHGWSQKAEFIDALNALLILDMTMFSIDELRKKNNLNNQKND